MEQLYYYMAHLRCNIGYLINFPHETGFPDVHNVGIVTGNQVNVFVNNCIYGDGIESISIPKDNKKVTNDKEKSLTPIIYKAVNTTVQEVVERDVTTELVHDLAKLDIDRPITEKVAVKGGKAVVQIVAPKCPVVKGPISPHSAANATVFVAPIASSTKQPCKVCVSKNELCRIHKGKY